MVGCLLVVLAVGDYLMLFYLGWCIDYLVFAC